MMNASMHRKFEDQEVNFKDIMLFYRFGIRINKF